MFQVDTAAPRRSWLESATLGVEVSIWRRDREYFVYAVGGCIARQEVWHGPYIEQPGGVFFDYSPRPPDR